MCVWIWEGGRDRHIRLDGNGKDEGETQRETQPGRRQTGTRGTGDIRLREKTECEKSGKIEKKNE